MKQYQQLIQDVLENGTLKGDRTGTGTISRFGTQSRYDLAEGFPLVTTKKMFTKGIIAELLWFLEGSTDERRLAEIQFGKPREELIGKNTIWTANADAQGKDLGYTNTDTIKELGPVYGAQWRTTSTYSTYEEVTLETVSIDQIEDVIESIKTNPNSRRHIVSAWNVAEIDEMALPPCHTMFQFNVDPLGDIEFDLEVIACGNLCREDLNNLPDLEPDTIKAFSTKWGIPQGKLSCQLYQRSADIFLGVPYNIASYALLTQMIAQVCNLKVGEFIHTIGDAHIYSNHIEQCEKILRREPLELPVMLLDASVESIDDFTMDSFDLLDYKSHDSIKGEMAV